MFSFFKRRKKTSPLTAVHTIQPNEGDTQKADLIRAINEATRSLPEPNPWGYCFCGEYVLRGVNPGTKRKNKISIFAPDYDSAVSAAEKELYQGPFELISGPQLVSPSDAQISYMGRLGLRIPPGSSTHDVTALLTRCENNDPSQVNTEFRAYARANGSVRSDLIGNVELYRRAYHATSAPERAALICYFIRKKDAGISVGDPREDARFEKDKLFADVIRADPSFLAKLQDFDGANLPKLNKTYALYKAARTYIDGN